MGSIPLEVEVSSKHKQGKLVHHLEEALHYIYIYIYIYIFG